MNETERIERAAKAIEACMFQEDGMYSPRDMARAALVAAAAPELDELLDSVGAVGVTIERLKQGEKPTTLWGATLYTDRFEYTGSKERSPMRALNGAVNHAREDAAIAATIAQATTTQEGASDE